MKLHPITTTLLPILIGLVFSAGAQTPLLEAYVQEGLQQNNLVRLRQLQYQQSLAAIDEARGLSLPNVGLNGSYTLAAGGRSIDLPIGDLLNGVYSTLNQLTQTENFPQVENVKEQLSPNNFYDLKVRTTYPVFNPDVKYNRQIKEQSASLKELDIAVQQKELSRDIRMGYFQYLQARQAVKIYSDALVLLRESQRVNQKLFDNGMANYTVVTRAKNEITKVEAQLQDAENIARNAGAYFNFLLNKSLDTPIIEDSTITNIYYPFPKIVEGNPGQREELTQLVLANGLQETVVKWQQTYKLPKVSAFLDLGSQAYNFQVGNGSFYALGGISIDLPIYSGNRNLAKIKQAELEVAATQARKAYVSNQLTLQWQTSLRSYQSALEVYQSTRGQVDSARRYFQDIEKRYREGQAIYIEYLDARNELTQAQLQQSIQLLNVWMRWAEMERAR